MNIYAISIHVTTYNARDIYFHMVASVCICMWIYICTSMYICMYNTYVCKYMCIHTYICTQKYVRVCVYINTQT